MQAAPVIKPRHHGDVLLNTPLFATLADRVIDAGALIYDDTAATLALNPDVRVMHCIGRDRRRLCCIKAMAPR